MEFMNRSVETCGTDVSTEIMKATFGCVKIPSDGVCLFNAVCFALMAAKLGVDHARKDLLHGRLPHISEALRHIIADDISDDDFKLKDEYRSFIYDDEEGLFGADAENYAMKLFAGEIFGGHLELMKCSQFFRVCIIVTQRDGDNFTCTPIGTEFFKGMGACTFIVLRKLHYNALFFKSSKH
jgi:hypothetical protein